MSKKYLTPANEEQAFKMKITDKITETKFYLEELRNTAKKHLNNKEMRRYKAVCNLILENENKLAAYRKESVCSSRVILKRIRSNAVYN